MPCGGAKSVGSHMPARVAQDDGRNAGRKCQFTEKQVFQFLRGFKKHVVALPQILMRIVWYPISNIVYCPIISELHRCMMCGYEPLLAAPRGQRALRYEPRSRNGRVPCCRITIALEMILAIFLYSLQAGQVFALRCEQQLANPRDALTKGIRAGDSGGSRGHQSCRNSLPRCFAHRRRDRRKSPGA
jgi:hypothetical protein